jgi:hypothetical protein
MNTSIPKVFHKYKNRIVVPWCAITGYKLKSFKKGAIIETSDKTFCKIIWMEEVHIGSAKAINLISEIYGVPISKFINEWYKRMPNMSSMWFLDLTLKEVKYVDTEGIPTEDN